MTNLIPIVLNGDERKVEFCGTNAWLRNDSANTLYASSLPNITDRKEGVVSIPSGQSAPVYGVDGEVFLLGDGSIQLIGSDYSTNPYAITSAIGTSNVDGTALSMISNHIVNESMHISSAERSMWNAKAGKSDIPTSLPANGGHSETASISQYIGTWGSPEQYYGEQLKVRVIFNKFNDNRLGLSTDTDNSIRVDFATDSECLGGHNANEYVLNSELEAVIARIAKLEAQ